MTMVPNPGVYAEQGALAEKAYNTALASIQNRKNGLLNQYGVNKQGGLDPYNQFGSVQQQNQVHGAQLQNAEYASEERGLGTSGLGAQPQTALRYQQGADTQNLGNTFTSDMLGLAGEKTQATDTFNQSLYNAKRQAIMAAIQSGNFNTPPAAKSKFTKSMPWNSKQKGY